MADKGARVVYITKKAKPGHVHHGGAWKVAYADFVTAMMALFMVLWLLSQTDRVTKQKLSEYFRTGMFQGAPSVMTGGSGIMENGFLDTSGAAINMDVGSLQSGFKSVKEALEQARKVNGELSRLVDQVDVKLIDEGILIQILDGGDDLIFDLSSSELKPKLKQLLALLAPALNNLENDIQVHGHTDARPFPLSVARNNWDLSYERASAARRELESNGLLPTRIVGVFAHASSVPYVKGDPMNPKNRRLAILALREPVDGRDAVKQSPPKVPGPIRTGAKEQLPKPGAKSPS